VQPHPVAGEDYPRHWREFLSWFATEAACLQFLEQLRWPSGFVCPQCDMGEEPFHASRGRLICRACRSQTSVIAGTLLEKTRTPLTTWFAAIWYVTNQKHGCSALGLQRVLGLGSYQTAWAMLHRLRRAMVRPGRERLRGVVEVDETYFGGQKRSVGGRHGRYKDIITIAVELHEPRGFGRVRLRRVDDVSEDSLLPFVTDSIELGSHVHTDGWSGYNALTRLGYHHQRTVLRTHADQAHVAMPGVHRVASLLKRWLLGTHQGAIQPAYLDDYLNEFAFRFNRRSSRSRGLLFYRLMEHITASEPITYRQIIARREEHNP
jgi:transposase-like protein